MLALETIDLAGFTADQIAGETEHRLNEERRRGFDLEVEPPSRVLLLRFADDEHVLALSLHALVGDPPTLRILAADLLAAYSALEPRAPALAARGNRSIRSWSGPPTLAARSTTGARACRTMPSRISRPPRAMVAVRRHSGGAPFRLGAARSVGLRELGRQLGVPIPTLLLTALHLLLAPLRPE